MPLASSIYTGPRAGSDAEERAAGFDTVLITASRPGFSRIAVSEIPFLPTYSKNGGGLDVEIVSDTNAEPVKIQDINTTAIPLRIGTSRVHRCISFVLRP